MEIIKDRKIITDSWSHLREQDDIPPEQPCTISLAQYTREQKSWTQRRQPWGIRLPNDVSIDIVEEVLDQVSLLTIEFPAFTDGRGYSLARSLRRAGYTNELRATGDVLQDQIAFMERCGFNSFDLKEGKSVRAALDAFDELSPAYQSSADAQPPRWRRVPSPSPASLV